VQVSMHECFRIGLSEFCERSLKRLAPRQDHGSLNEILEFTNIAGPVPSPHSGAGQAARFFGDEVPLLCSWLCEVPPHLGPKPGVRMMIDFASKSQALAVTRTDHERTGKLPASGPPTSRGHAS